MSLGRALAWDRAGAALSAAPSASLRRTVFWTFVGNAIYRACQWGMLIAIAKLSTPVAAGQFALAFAITVPVFTLANAPARGLLATDARGEFPLATYLALRRATTTLAAVALAGLALLGPYGRETMLVLLALTAAKAVESMSDIHHGALQRIDRTEAIALSLGLKGVLSLAGLVVALYLTGSVVVGATAIALAWAVVLRWYDAPATAGLRGASAPATGPLLEVRRLALQSAPLALVTLLLALKFSAPRLIVAHQMGEAALGFFAAMVYATLAFEMVVGSLAQGAAPRLARHFHDGDARAFTRLLSQMALVAATLGTVVLAVVFAAGGPLLATLYRPEYAAYTSAFVLLVAASSLGLVATVFGYVATATRRLHDQIWVSALVLAASAAGSWVLVPRLGLDGAAIGELIAMLVHTAGLGWIVWRMSGQLHARPA